MTKQQQKQIDKLYEEEQKKFVEWKRKENPKREKELLDRFGEDRLQRLRKSLDYIQNNEFVHAIFTNANPLKVTPEELVFLEEEDKLERRYFVDFGLREYHKETKSFSPRWVRIPFQTNAQVKRTLKWIFKTNQKVEDLNIIDENDLDLKVDWEKKDGSPLQLPLRVVRYSERYNFDFDWKHKIELSHKISIEVVSQKEVDEEMDKLRERYSRNHMDFELDDRQFNSWVDFAYNNDKSILSDETKIERVSTETKEVLN